MAGSFTHILDDDGRLLGPEAMSGMLDTDGDVYETVEQLYGMIWLLADGFPDTVAAAARDWRTGVSMSPGRAS